MGLALHPSIPLSEHCPEKFARDELHVKPVHPRVHSHADAHDSMTGAVIATAGLMSNDSQQSPLSYPWSSIPAGTHWPSPSENFIVPCGHDIHGPPLWPVNPGLHRQSSILELPAGEKEFGGHRVQDSFLNAGLAYFPAEQTSHDSVVVEMFDLTAYFPAGQGMQTFGSDFVISLVMFLTPSCVVSIII